MPKSPIHHATKVGNFMLCIFYLDQFFHHYYHYIDRLNILIKVSSRLQERLGYCLNHHIKSTIKASNVLHKSLNQSLKKSLRTNCMSIVGPITCSMARSPSTHTGEYRSLFPHLKRIICEQI